MSDLDKYRAKGTVADMPIGLEPADVASLPSAGRVSFAMRGGAPGDVPVVDFELFTDGLRRLLNTYVAGMHAGYGLSALTDPTTFLLAVRRLADELYGDDPVVDASAGNAAFRRAIDALYPEITATGNGAPAPAAPPGRPLVAPVFVVGCPRSGTTWLQAMLLAHPGLAGPDEETAIFSSVKDILANAGLDAWAGHDRVVAAVRRFVEEMLGHAVRDAPAGTRLIEKTPHHALHLDIIEALFPDAFVIAIHRDGRDVVRSLLEVPFGTPDPARAARGWVESTTAVEGFRPTTLRVRDVRYETLRADPVTGISDLLEWVGLTVDASVVEELRGRADRRVSEHNQREVALSPSATNAVYRYAGDQLVRLGYLDAAELAAIRGSLRYRATVVRADAEHLARRTLGKLRRLRKN